MTATPDPVGLVGFGLLGAALAGRLQAAGAAVHVYDRDPRRVAEAAAASMSAEPSVGAVSSRSREVVIAVYDAEQAHAVVEELRPGTLAVLATTLSPAAAVEIVSRGEAAGVAVLELPISGTSREVGEGTALGLTGGNPERIEKAWGLLTILTGRVVVVGGVGDAARAKLAINLVLELNRTALAEGLRLAELLGLELDAFAPVLRVSAAASRVMDAKADKMRRGDFAPDARVHQSLKDVRLMLEQAAACGQRLPLTEAQAGLLEATAIAGDGDLDPAAVLRQLRRVPVTV